MVGGGREDAINRRGGIDGGATPTTVLVPPRSAAGTGGTSDGTQAFDLTYSPDGRRLITAGDHFAALSTGTTEVVQQWYTQPARLETAACARLTHNLSSADWAQYLTGEPYDRTCPNLPSG